MQTRAQRKRMENNALSAIKENNVRKLRIVLKRLTKDDLQKPGVSIYDSWY